MLNDSNSKVTNKTNNNIKIISSTAEEKHENKSKSISLSNHQDFYSTCPRIDKLTLTQHVLDQEHQMSIRDWIEGACDDGEGENFYSKGHKYYRYSYKFPISADGRQNLLVQISPYWKKIPFLRIDWNPNKAGKLGNEIVQDLCINFYLDSGYDFLYENAKISRLDTCLDIADLELDNILVTAPKIKNWARYGTDKLETVYLGTQKSKNRYRIYNKRQQLIDVEKYDPSTLPIHLTRFESIQKNSGLTLAELAQNMPNPFSDLAVVDKTHSDHYKDEFFLEYARQYGLPKALNKIKNISTRTSYLKRLGMSAKLKIQWQPEIYWQEFQGYFETSGLIPIHM